MNNKTAAILLAIVAIAGLGIGIVGHPITSTTTQTTTQTQTNYITQTTTQTQYVNYPWTCTVSALNGTQWINYGLVYSKTDISLTESTNGQPILQIMCAPN